MNQLGCLQSGDGVHDQRCDDQMTQSKLTGGKIGQVCDGCQEKNLAWSLRFFLLPNALLSLSTIEPRLRYQRCRKVIK
jgi:hypothetical protein